MFSERHYQIIVFPMYLHLKSNKLCLVATHAEIHLVTSKGGKRWRIY